MLTSGPRCPQHQQQRDRDDRERERAYDQARGSAAARGYDYAWQRYAAGYLREHPWCVEHLERGERVQATRVDHMIPHRGDRRLFWDPGNHHALCESDHNRKTAGRDGGFGNAPVSNT